MHPLLLAGIAGLALLLLSDDKKEPATTTPEATAPPPPDKPKPPEPAFVPPPGVPAHRHSYPAGSAEGTPCSICGKPKVLLACHKVKRKKDTVPRVVSSNAPCIPDPGKLPPAGEEPVKPT